MDGSLARGQRLKVKVISVEGSRISLSTKDVEQTSERNITPQKTTETKASSLEEENGQSSNALTGTSLLLSSTRSRSQSINSGGHLRSVRHLTSPERWEIKQLRSSGVMDGSVEPDEVNTGIARAEVDEELDIEVREDEPPFLAGQTKRSLHLSPVKIVKAPDGSLNRAALAGAALAKERRELRQQEVNEQADSEARDFATPWLDPMSQASERMFAQDLKNNLVSQIGESSRWREKAFNKATTFGKITDLSIQNQRMALPIYKLREPLMDAIREVI